MASQLDLSSLIVRRITYLPLVPLFASDPSIAWLRACLVGSLTSASRWAHPIKLVQPNQVTPPAQWACRLLLAKYLACMVRPLLEERYCQRSRGSIPELVDDNIDEILVHLSPEDPALLVHASAVSKSWCRTLANWTFPARYREFHRTPPVLGIFRRDGILILTTSFLPPAVHHFNCHVLDYRHGRVLLENLNCGEIVIWDPMTGYQACLPEVPDNLALVTNGAVLCAADADCDHLDCHDGPFRVALVGADPEGQLHACVYSSNTDMWSPHTSLDINDDIPPEVFSNAYLVADVVPGALVGGVLYFIGDFYNKILRYDLVEPSLSVIETPVKETCDNGVIVMREEDGGLGFTFVKANNLHLWSMRKGRDGKNQWTNFRAIDLEKLLPVGRMSPYVSGFVDGSNCVVMKTDDEVFTIELKSLQTRKVCKREQAYCGFLYTAFWTPEFAAGLPPPEPNED